MTNDPQNFNPSQENAPALRVRTFLKGVVYYDNRSVSIECTVRDLSETGARVALETLVSVPDSIELYIPHRQRTYPARVVRRSAYELGVVFEDQRSSEPRRATDMELSERVTKIEHELASMNRLLKQLKAKVLPPDGE